MSPEQSKSKITKEMKFALSVCFYFDSCFRQVVRVPQLGCHVEPEIIGVLDRGVSQSDAERPALFERLFQQQRLQQRVNFFANVLQQYLKPSCNSKPITQYDFVMNERLTGVPNCRQFSSVLT